MMILAHIDGSYLSESQAFSRVGGHFFKGDQEFNQSYNNGAVITISQLHKHLMTSASEAEWESLFLSTPGKKF